MVELSGRSTLSAAVSLYFYHPIEFFIKNPVVNPMWVPSKKRNKSFEILSFSWKTLNKILLIF